MSDKIQIGPATAPKPYIGAVAPLRVYVGKYPPVYNTQFSPSSLPASPIVHYDANDLGSITESGGFVTQWNDLSGNGYHMTPVVASTITKVGRYIVMGVAEMIASIPASTFVNDISIFIVARNEPNSFQTNFGIIRRGNGGEPSASDTFYDLGYNLHIKGTATAQWEWYSAGSYGGYYDEVFGSNVFRKTGLLGGTSQGYSNNGVSYLSPPATNWDGTDAGTKLNLGSSPNQNGGYINWEVGEVLIFNGLSEANRLLVESYLSGKWRRQCLSQGAKHIYADYSCGPDTPIPPTPPYDPSLWTKQTTTSIGGGSGLAYGNGRWVKMGHNGGVGADIRLIETSDDDGVTWTARTAPNADGRYDKAIYAKGTFVCASQTGASAIITSTNGVSWVNRTAALSNLVGITYTTYGSGFFVAVALTGAANTHMWSADGSNWTTSTDAASGHSLRGICNGAYGLISVGSNGANVAIHKSTDGGATFTDISPAVAGSLQGVAYIGGTYLAIGANGLALASFDGGDSWVTRTTPTSDDFTHIAAGSSTSFVAVGASTDDLMTSEDLGVTWTVRGGFGHAYDDVVWGHGIFMTVATSSSQDGGANLVMTST